VSKVEEYQNELFADPGPSDRSCRSWDHHCPHGDRRGRCGDAANLRRALADARSGFVTVILDLHNVWFFGAAGLNVVAAAHKHAPALGDFRLRDPSPAVRRVLDISGLDRVVPIEVTTVEPSPGRCAPTEGFRRDATGSEHYV
jgi:anti-anti-sigma factor